MPTLPEQPEPPAGPTERIGAAIRRAGAGIGVDSPSILWAAVLLVVIAVCLSLSVTPWAQIGLAATILLVLDLLRTRRRP